MSLKSIIKKCCPDFLLPVLRVPYRIAAWPYRTAKRYMVAHRALKYLPYYQDELSREILNDRIQYLKSGDPNIFLNRAVNEGWDIRLYDIIEGHVMNEGKYTGILVIYKKESKYLEYTKRLLELNHKLISYRIVALDEFLNGCDVSEHELIVAIDCIHQAKDFIAAKKMNNDLAWCIVSGRKEAQYLDVFEPVDDEIIIDAGCYNGATAIRFLEWGKGKVKRVYSFEFDPSSYARCERNLEPYKDRVTLINCGLWDKDEVIYTAPNGSGGSTVFSEGSTEIRLTSIDNVVNGGAVTLIELDIEGAELKALMGAKNTIIRHRPRLAISLYHKPEDLYEIPGYILSLVPEYKFYLRHYASNEWETVLYAYCE